MNCCGALSAAPQVYAYRRPREGGSSTSTGLTQSFGLNKKHWRTDHSREMRCLSLSKADENVNNVLTLHCVTDREGSERKKLLDSLKGGMVHRSAKLRFIEAPFIKRSCCFILYFHWCVCF